MKKVKTKIEPLKLKLLTLKVSLKDFRLLQSQAKKYANGNLSAWLRHSALTHVPKASEKISFTTGRNRYSKTQVSK